MKSAGGANLKILGQVFLIQDLLAVFAFDENVRGEIALLPRGEGFFLLSKPGHEAPFERTA